VVFELNLPGRKGMLTPQTAISSINACPDRVQIKKSRNLNRFEHIWRVLDLHSAGNRELQKYNYSFTIPVEVVPVQKRDTII